MSNIPISSFPSARWLMSSIPLCSLAGHNALGRAAPSPADVAVAPPSTPSPATSLLLALPPLAALSPPLASTRDLRWRKCQIRWQGNSIWWWGSSIRWRRWRWWIRRVSACSSSTPSSRGSACSVAGGDLVRSKERTTIQAGSKKGIRKIRK